MAEYFPKTFKEYLKEHEREEEGRQEQQNLATPRFDFSVARGSENVPSKQPRIFSPYAPTLYRDLSNELPADDQPPNLHVTNKSSKSHLPSLPTESPKSKKKLILSPLKTKLSPSKPSKVQLPKKKRNWTTDETKIFLGVYANWEKKMRTKGKKKSVWLCLHKQFLISCKKNKCPADRDIRHLQDRWRYVLKEYKRVKDNNRRTGANREDFEFYDEVEAIVGKRQSINPTDTLGVMDEPTTSFSKSSASTSSKSRDHHESLFGEDESTDDDDDDVDATQPDSLPRVSDDNINPVASNVTQKKKQAKKATIADVVNTMHESLHAQNALLADQIQQDNELMKQFISMSERAEERQQEIIEAIMRLSR